MAHDADRWQLAAASGATKLVHIVSPASLAFAWLRDCTSHVIHLFSAKSIRCAYWVFAVRCEFVQRCFGNQGFSTNMVKARILGRCPIDLDRVLGGFWIQLWEILIRSENLELTCILNYILEESWEDLEGDLGGDLNGILNGSWAIWKGILKEILKWILVRSWLDPDVVTNVSSGGSWWDLSWLLIGSWTLLQLYPVPQASSNPPVCFFHKILHTTKKNKFSCSTCCKMSESDGHGPETWGKGIEQMS